MCYIKRALMPYRNSKDPYQPVYLCILIVSKVCFICLSVYFALICSIPSGHITFIQSRININATSLSDVASMLTCHCVSVACRYIVLNREQSERFQHVLLKLTYD